MKFNIFLFLLFLGNIALFIDGISKANQKYSPQIEKAGFSIEIGPRSGYYGCYPYYYGYPPSGFNFGFYMGPRRYYNYCPPGYYYRYGYPRRYYYRDYRDRRYHKRKRK